MFRLRSLFYCARSATMGRKPSCTPEMRAIIVRMYCSKNQSLRHIADQLGVGKTMVWNAVKQYRETGTCENKIRELRPSKTTPIEDRRIVKLSKQNPFLTSKRILQQLQPDLAQEISSSTVRRRLLKADLRGCIARRKPMVSKKNIAARLQFARAHLGKPMQYWKKVLWSDESKFNLCGSDGKVYVRRPPNKQFDPRYTIKTVKHGGGSIMVWGAFSWHGVGPLVRVQGIMDQHQYKAILQDSMVVFADDNLPVNYLFQHDNDPKHTSRLVKQFLRESYVDVMDWPAQSPDLNPIEHVWSHVERELSSQICSSADRLFAKIQEIWENISLEYLRKLVESMPRRCQEVISNKGHPTSY